MIMVRVNNTPLKNLIKLNMKINNIDKKFNLE